MEALTISHPWIGTLAAEVHGVRFRTLRLKVRPMLSGLEGASVAHVTARLEDPAGRARQWSLIVKQLRGTMVREAAIYQGLVAASASAWSPRLLAVERRPDGHVRLYLEALRPVARWPWHDTAFARRVLERLASLHSAELSPTSAAALVEWDYEAELDRSAASTLEMLDRFSRDHRVAPISYTRQPARRMALALRAMRRQLFAFRSFGSVPIHGDMHPGNVIVRRVGGAAEPALLDWSRARIGSPLEDVSSWLQSLGYWEPEARRRHDTLLAHYLRSRGAEGGLLPDVRVLYWLAGASNALSGALRYHLSVALDRRTGSARRASAVQSARDWLRVLRRADACWS